MCREPINSKQVYHLSAKEALSLLDILQTHSQSFHASPDAFHQVELIFDRGSGIGCNVKVTVKNKTLDITDHDSW